MRSAAELGWTGLQLSPLDGEADAKVGTAGAPEADEVLLLAQLREALTQRLRQAPDQPQMLACLKVWHAWTSIRSPFHEGKYENHIVHRYHRRLSAGTSSSRHCCVAST